MKKFTVIFHPEAETDISLSYEWGCRVCGPEKANAWAKEFRLTTQVAYNKGRRQILHHRVSPPARQ